MRQFLLPDLGEGLEEAEIVAWHVDEGDHVVADQPLVSVETDKAVVEVPSPRSGRIARLFGAKGDLVKVGAPLVEFAEGPEADTGTVVGELDREEDKRAAGPQAPAEPARARTASGPAGGARAGAQARCRSQPRAGQRPRRHHHARRCRARRQEPGRGGTGRGAQGHAPRHGAAHGGGACRGGARQRDGRGRHRRLDDRARTSPSASCARSPPPARPSRRSTPGTMPRPASAGSSSASTSASPSIPRAASSFRCCAMSASATRATCAPGSTACGPTPQARSIPPEELRGATITLSNFGMIGGRFANLVVVPPQVAIVGAGRIAQAGDGAQWPARRAPRPAVVAHLRPPRGDGRRGGALPRCIAIRP